MTDSPTLVPSDELAAQLPKIGEKYFVPEALELCRSLKGRKAADLSEDEILMLALTAAQAALAKHIEPGNRDAAKTLHTILAVLDHDTVIQAEIRKLHQKKVRTTRMITLGMKPGYQTSGIGAAIYTTTMRVGMQKGYTAGEASWILEDNVLMVRPIESLGAKQYKRWRIYDRAL